MSILGDIIGREWLECELEEARDKLAVAQERAKLATVEAAKARCAGDGSDVGAFMAENAKSFEVAERLLTKSLAADVQRKIAFLEHLLS